MAAEELRRRTFAALSRRHGAAKPHEAVEGCELSKLGEIQTGTQPGQYRVFLYGEPGVGKSSIAVASPRALIFDLEFGTRQLSCARYPLDEITMDGIRAGIDDLIQNNHEFGYEWLWFDGVHVLEHLIFGGVTTRAAKRHGKQYEGIKDVGGGFGKGEALAVTKWREFLSLLEKLQRKTGISVGLLGHAKLGKRKDVGDTDWDCWAPRLDDKAGDLIAGWCDMMGFCGHEQYGHKNKDDKFARGKGSETGDRYIHTTRSATHKAKRRFSMPDRILMVHPDQGDPWAPFAAALAGFEMSRPQLLEAIKAELDRIGDDTIGTATLEFFGAQERTIDQHARTLQKLRSK